MVTFLDALQTGDMHTEEVKTVLSHLSRVKAAWKVKGKNIPKDDVRKKC